MAYLRKLAGLLAFLALIGGSATACAQTATPPPEALALVQELPLKNFSDSFVAGLQRKLLTDLTAKSTLTPSAVAHVVNNILAPEFAKRFGELELAGAAIYAARFTPQELAEMRVFIQDRSPARQQAFLATPTGQKYLTQQATINQLFGNAARDWGIRTALIAFAAHADELRALGLDPETGNGIPPVPPR